MQQTLFSRKQLAERWGYDSTRAIVDLEQEGVITRIPGISSPRYSINEIEKIENLGKEVSPLSPLERKKLEVKINNLEKERDLLLNTLNKLKSILNG